MLRRVRTIQYRCGCGPPTTTSTLRKCSTTTTTGENKQKSLNITMIGTPNAGKSTLVNYLVGNRVCAVSHIANTTRIHANGMYTEGDTQLVFTDTPGVIPYEEGRRLGMHGNMIRTPKRMASIADILAVMVDVANTRTRKHVNGEILDIMKENEHIPAILIMNKVDLLKNKQKLIHLVNTLTTDREKDEWGYQETGGSSRFREVFFTDSRSGEGCEDLREYLLSVAPPRKWEYSEDVYCESSVQVLISEVVREKLLLIFGQEIPWKCKQETVQIMGIPHQGYVRIHHKLQWPKKSQVRYVLSKEEELMKQCIGELQHMFKCRVHLTIDVEQGKNMTVDDTYTF